MKTVRPTIQESAFPEKVKSNPLVYELISYRQEFNEEIIELQQYLWGSDLALNAKYLRWKYENNPYIDNHLIFLALSSGKPIGMIGVYGSRWEMYNEGQPCVVPCFGDLVIHPDHRNKGLFLHLVQFALHEISKTNYKYIFDWGGEEVALTLMMRGWRHIGFVETGGWQKKDRKPLSGDTYDRIAYFLGHAYRRMRRLGQRHNLLKPSQDSHCFRRFDNVNRSYFGKVRSHVSIEKSPRPAEMTELVKRNGGHGRIRHVRDAQYFSWRFQNPLSQYRFLYWEQSLLEGYLVLQVGVAASGNSAQIHIVDWETTNLRVWKELLQAAIEVGGFSSLTIWSGTLSEEKRGILENLNFGLESPIGKISHDSTFPTLVLRPIQPELFQSHWAGQSKRMLSLASWDLRMIYSDDF